MKPSISAATLCFAIALSPIPATAQPYAFVANQYNVSNRSSVTVINTANASVVSTVPLGTGPWNVAITPDGSRAYVTNTDGSNSVSVIDTNLTVIFPASAVIAEIPVGTLPTGIAITPDGAYAFVANNLSSSVSIIDTTVQAVLPPVLLPSGATPFGIAITPDGAHAYVTDRSSNRVFVIDTSLALTNPFAAVVAITLEDEFHNSYGAPSLIAISPDGASAYVTLASFSGILRIDTSSNTVAGLQFLALDFGGVPLGSGDGSSLGLAVSPDGSRVYTTYSEPAPGVILHSGLAVIDLMRFGFHPIADVAVGHEPGFVAITPDGSQVYVTNTFDDTVSVVSTSLNSAVGSPIPVGQFPRGVAIQGSFTGMGSMGITPPPKVPVNLAVTVPNGSQTGSVQWDFFGDGSVVQSTSSLTTQFTYPSAGLFHPVVVVTSAPGTSAGSTAGATLRETIPLRIQSPAQGISAETALVKVLPLNDNDKGSLLNKLNAAAGALGRSNVNAACGPMGAFMNEVNALVQSDRLSPQAAMPVLGEDNAIRLSLGCGS